MIDFRNQKALIISPHPDDEVIGCGGLIKRIKDAGGSVYVLFLTAGDTKDFSKKGASSLAERKIEIKRVAKFLRFDGHDIAFDGSVYHLQLDSLSQKKIMDVIERSSCISLEKIKPTLVAYPSFSSYNQDHRAASRAAFAALRPAEKRMKHFVPLVLQYEEPADNWTLESASPLNFFVSLTEKEFEAKTCALQLYTSQMREFPNLRSAKSLAALATLRGAQISNTYAEAFYCARNVT